METTRRTGTRGMSTRTTVSAQPISPGSRKQKWRCRVLCAGRSDSHGSSARRSSTRGWSSTPAPAADLGQHRFTYALMPHPGDFREAGVIAAAEDLNNPLRVVRGGGAAGERRSLIEVDQPQVVVEAIKRAEDSDAVVVRLYEAWGGRCRAKVRTSLPVSRAYLCDLLERDRAEMAGRDGEPEFA